MAKRRGTLRSITGAGKRLAGLFTIPTIAVLGGAALMAWGLWMVDPALSAIVMGGGLVTFGLWAAGVGTGGRG